MIHGLVTQFGQVPEDSSATVDRPNHHYQFNHYKKIKEYKVT